VIGWLGERGRENRENMIGWAGPEKSKGGGGDGSGSPYTQQISIVRNLA
jgi:hypothetical protein